MITVNNRDKIDWNEGMTVQSLLDKMRFSYKLITVTVNDEVVLEEDYSTHLLHDKDSVGVFHLAHGG